MADPILSLMLRAGVSTEHREDIQRLAEQVSGFGGGPEHIDKVQRASFVILQAYVKGASSRRCPGLPDLGELATGVKDGFVEAAQKYPPGATYNAACTATVTWALASAAETGARLQAGEVDTLRREREEAREEGYNRGWLERDMGIPLLEQRSREAGKQEALRAVRDGGPTLGALMGLAWVEETRRGWLEQGAKNADGALLARVTELEADLAEARAQSLDGFQEACLRTWNRGLSPREALMNAAVGLVTEGAEALDQVKKEHWHGHPHDPDKLANEGGDVLFYAAALATCIGRKLSEIAAGNVGKLLKRFPRGFNSADSIARADVAREEPCPGCGQPKLVGQKCQRLVCCIPEVESDE